jgi:hypothetical protein
VSTRVHCRTKSFALAATIGTAVLAAPATGQVAGFFAGLKGTTQVPPVSTSGIGSFIATLGADGSSINYTLTVLEPVGTITQSHIHFGPENNTGGIMMWLCGSPGFEPASGPTPPDCPAAGGAVTGTLTPASVQSVGSQGIAAGDFEAFLDAVRSGTGYVNVHTTSFPPGEIRGQVISGP